jgi:hypothetical protein
MRLSAVAAAVMLAVSAPTSAQEWIEFISREDRFTCNFPGEPKVTETTFKSQFGADLPTRIYQAESGPSRYSLTVVDYRNIEDILTEKSKACPDGAETCRGGGTSTGAGYWKADLAGAMIYATRLFMQRDAQITELQWTNIDLVEGHLLHLTNTPDKSRTFVAIFMHENRLYISEGTVPAGYPEPGLFHQSLGWLDADGNGIRYQTHYHNGFPVPPSIRTGGSQR